MLLYSGVTRDELRWNVAISINGRFVFGGMVYLGPITEHQRCLDPTTMPPRWRSGCLEHDIGFEVPQWALSPGEHTIDMQVHSADSSEERSAQEVRTTYVVVSPPIVELFLPVHDHRFVCSGTLTIVFTYGTDYEPSTDFLEMGAGFHGAGEE